MSGLSDYLNSLNKEGWSTRRISREAEKHGHTINYSTVSKYLRGSHGEPQPEMLEALAAAFRVDVNALREAAGRPPVGEPFDLGPESARLTGPQREAIRTITRLFLEQNTAVDRGTVPHGATAHVSPLRPRLVSDDVDPRVLEMPFAADEEKPGDDPGEDEH